jgi:hypothetical protein
MLKRTRRNIIYYGKYDYSFMFSIPCIMDQFIKKYQQDVTSQYFISCFVVLYMFRTRSVSIIRRSIKLTGRRLG